MHNVNALKSVPENNLLTDCEILKGAINGLKENK